MSKYEKVDETKITKEHSQIVDIPNVVKAKEQMLKEIEGIKKQLVVVVEILNEAKKLGLDITLKPKPRPTPTKGEQTL